MGAERQSTPTIPYILDPDSNIRRWYILAAELDAAAAMLALAQISRDPEDGRRLRLYASNGWSRDEVSGGNGAPLAG